MKALLSGLLLLVATLMLGTPAAMAAPAKSPAAISAPLSVPGGGQTETANVVRIVLILSLMAFLPALVICMTSFVRIVVVLSMIRHAFGMPETPPSRCWSALRCS